MPYARPTPMTTTATTMAATVNGDGLLSIESAEPSPWETSTQVSGLNHRPSDPAWQHHLSATFSQLSERFRDASQALSTISPLSEDTTSLMERLGYVEMRQKDLEADIRELRDLISTPQEQPASGVEALLKEHMELFKLDQERLPGRLQNSLATKSLSPLKMLPMRNRKFPPNAPATRGEFEHLTKERYEALMTSYEVPISGDTSAKREALRAFLGIPSLPLEKK